MTARGLLRILSRPVHAVQQQWRRTMLRLAGASVGASCTIGCGVKVAGPVVLGHKVILQDGCELRGNVRIGDGAAIQRHAEISGNVDIGDEATVGSFAILSTMPTAHLRIGRRVLVNSFNVIGAGERVTIADDCIFAAHVYITDSSHHYENASDSPRHDGGYSKPVEIGGGVWLGSGVKVIMGVEIGQGAVVGAGAVVTRSVPAMAIAVGMPARVIRFRKEGARPTAGADK